MLRGETRPSRINDEEPRPRDVPPEMPEWLTGAAASEWRRIAPDLTAMGTVKAVDAIGLAAYCEAVARFKTATELIGRAGLMIRDRDGMVRKNPAVAQARDASLEIRMWAREFGLTPAARQPLRVSVDHHGLPAERLLSS